MHSKPETFFKSQFIRFVIVVIAGAYLFVGCKEEPAPEDEIPQWVTKYKIQCPAESKMRLDENSKYCVKLGKPHGPMMKWYPNGKKYQKSSHTNGNEDGEWLEWYQNGKKKAHANYINGNPEGKQLQWFKSGQKQAESYYKNGEPFYSPVLYRGCLEEQKAIRNYIAHQETLHWRKV